MVVVTVSGAANSSTRRLACRGPGHRILRADARRPLTCRLDLPRQRFGVGDDDLVADLDLIQPLDLVRHRDHEVPGRSRPSA